MYKAGIFINFTDAVLQATHVKIQKSKIWFNLQFCESRIEFYEASGSGEEGST